MSKMRFSILAAAVLAAAFLFAALPLPSRPLALMPRNSQVPITVGSFHIHTNRSDGSGSADDVAAAAARAGLNFIVLTDHGDGTRRPDPPQYRSGVLVIDAVELSTESGHYIAVGMPQAPYPLRGEGRDVAEDVRRLGGFGVVAHPHSSKPALRWRAWNADVDALEWLNADTEWRDEHTGQLVRALLRYPFRPAETLASLLDRPDSTLAQWDAVTRRRPVVALAGADAHARAGWMDDDDAEGYTRGWFLRIPSYDASFRTFAMRVALPRPLGNDAAAAASLIIDAIKRGAVYTAIDALATPASLEFFGASGDHRMNQGEIFEDTAAALTFTARANTTGGTIVLRKDGSIVARHPLPALTFDAKGEGTYRVEVYLSNAPGQPATPWIVSNPIYVRSRGWGTRTPDAVSQPTITLSIQGGPWRVEKDDASTARVTQQAPETGPVRFTFRLGGGERAGRYAALGIGVGKALTERTHLAFRAYSARPMRISVQARQPHSGERWQRSIYLDANPRDVIVRFTDMTPVGSSGRFDPSLADTVLFVVDTTNTQPGTEGSFTLENLRVER